jgi:signal transduction histidine kinase
MNAKSEKFIDTGGIAMIAEGPTRPADEEPAASSLIAHIQGAMEHQKALLARELHDELGGLLVGAVMDLAWAEQHLSAPPAELRQKLTRARQTLAAAIDLKRKLIEDLRPTLLDNVGLFAALRWHVAAACKRAGLSCTIDIPEEERRFLPNIPIVLFRIVQEALAVIVARKPVASAAFSVIIDRRTLIIEVHSDAAAAPADADTRADEHFLAAVAQRVASLGGEFKSAYLPTGGTRIAARFALESTLVPGGDRQ